MNDEIFNRESKIFADPKEFKDYNDSSYNKVQGPLLWNLKLKKFIPTYTD